LPKVPVQPKFSDDNLLGWGARLLFEVGPPQKESLAGFEKIDQSDKIEKKYSIPPPGKWAFTGILALPLVPVELVAGK